MNKHTCSKCNYCFVKKVWIDGKYVSSPVCTASPEEPTVDILRKHFCEMFKTTKNPSVHS